MAKQVKKYFQVEISINEDVLKRKFPNYGKDFDDGNEFAAMIMRSFNKDSMKEFGYRIKSKRIFKPIV